MRLEESMSWPAPRNIPASYTTVESVEKVDKGMTSGSEATKRRWHSAHLALASAAVEKARVVDDENCVLRKRKRTSMTNASCDGRRCGARNLPGWKESSMALAT